MFSKCSSLIELNIFNFNTNKVFDMSYLFYMSSALKEIHISNFIANNEVNMYYMLKGCLDELKLKMKQQLKNLKDEAFL